MLYATTRSDHDTYTAQRALKEPCAPDGGLYVPMRLKTLSKEELDVLLEQGTPGILAALLNYFFSCKLSRKDVEFALGKHIAKLEHMSHRITIAQCWHNPDRDFSRIDRLLAKLAAVDKRETPVGEWLKVVSRIGLLFCVYARMRKENRISDGEKLDVAVLSGDFTAPMAAWTARAMGLPIGNIVCCCNENGAIWDLFQQGEMHTGSPVRKTSTPKCDISCPDGLERLVRLSLDLKEARRFAFARQEKSDYLVERQFRDPFPGMYASVITDRRIPQIISNVHSTNGYILCPYSALVYAGLMDYRANTGCNGQALLICESGPEHCEDAVAKALGMTVPQLHERLDII